jgi:hypothetical protein
VANASRRTIARTGGARLAWKMVDRARWARETSTLTGGNLRVAVGHSFAIRGFATVVVFAVGQWSTAYADSSFKLVTQPVDAKQAPTMNEGSSFKFVTQGDAKQAQAQPQPLPVVPHADEIPPEEPATVAAPVAAQSTARWTFDVLTIRQSGRTSTLKHTPMGRWDSRDKCEIARAKKTFDLDRDNSRQPHLIPDQPPDITTISTAASTITRQTPGGPVETIDVTACRDHEPQTGGRLTVRVEDCGKTPIFVCAGQWMGGPPQRMRAVPVRPARHFYFGSDQPTSDLQRLWYDP